MSDLMREITARLRQGNPVPDEYLPGTHTLELLGLPIRGLERREMRYVYASGLLTRDLDLLRNLSRDEMRFRRVPGPPDHYESARMAQVIEAVGVVAKAARALATEAQQLDDALAARYPQMDMPGVFIRTFGGGAIMSESRWRSAEWRAAGTNGGREMMTELEAWDELVARLRSVEAVRDRLSDENAVLRAERDRLRKALLGLRTCFQADTDGFRIEVERGAFSFGERLLQGWANGQTMCAIRAADAALGEPTGDDDTPVR